MSFEIAKLFRVILGVGKSESNTRIGRGRYVEIHLDGGD